MTERTADLIIRDPLWNTIRVDPLAVRILDSPAFQRLRYIRQLGLAHLVYPGATHTRFDHALGVYHLARTALHRLGQASGVPPEAWRDADLVPYAALLHDIGHFAFSHALEELEPDVTPGDHEEASAAFFDSPELREALAPLGDEAPGRILALIRGRSPHPLGGLVSGSLDLDKMEYLRRDARFCGVPYGEVDVDRLLQGMLILQDPGTGAWEVGIHRKAISALESLLFAKYQMFRNVYWHHAVRAATALYKRIVDDAVRLGLISRQELVGPTDEALLYEIERRAGERRGSGDPGVRRIAERWLPGLRNRLLPKRALEFSAVDLEGWTLHPWLAGDTPRKRELEDALARETGLEPGEVVVDFPVKDRMFELDVLVYMGGGRVSRLTPAGIPGLIDLPRLAAELYRSARVLRIFTFRRRSMKPEAVLPMIARPRGNPEGAPGVY